VPLVGGKNASLGEMYRRLAGDGVRVPNGFAITAEAYRHMLEAGGAMPALRAALDGLDPADVSDLARRAKRAREIVYGASLPHDLRGEILAGYRQLQEQYGEDVRARGAQLGDGRGSTDGEIYRGAVAFRVDRTEIGDMDRPRTKVMVNLGRPSPRRSSRRPTGSMPRRS